LLANQYFWGEIDLRRVKWFLKSLKKN
jgi:hypothetical protein